MSKAVSLLANDSAMIRVELSGVTAMPLGKASLSATWCSEPSGLTSAMIPGQLVSAHEVEADFDYTGVAAAADDDLVPPVLREAAEIDVGDERAAGAPCMNAARRHRRTRLLPPL
jgi:hypothetical protein